MKKVGRNEPCPCGSGKKYKNCHEKSDSPVTKSNNGIIVIAVLIVLLAMAIYSIVQNASNSGSSRPDGPAPAGKVWSEEHGHWHDL